MQLNLLLVWLACLTLGNYRMKRSILYPPFIFCAMWLVVMSIYWTRPLEVDPLHGETLLLLSAGAGIFSIAGVLAELIPVGGRRAHPRESPPFIRSRMAAG